MNVYFEERAIYGLVVVLGAALALFSTAFKGREAPAPKPRPAATCPEARYCPGPTWYLLVGTGDFSVPPPEGGGGHPTNDF